MQKIHTERWKYDGVIRAKHMPPRPAFDLQVGQVPGHLGLDSFGTFCVQPLRKCAHVFGSEGWTVLHNAASEHLFLWYHCSGIHFLDGAEQLLVIDICTGKESQRSPLLNQIDLLKTWKMKYYAYKS